MGSERLRRARDRPMRRTSVLTPVRNSVSGGRAPIWAQVRLARRCSQAQAAISTRFRTPSLLWVLVRWPLTVLDRPGSRGGCCQAAAPVGVAVLTR